VLNSRLLTNWDGPPAGHAQASRTVLRLVFYPGSEQAFAPGGLGLLPNKESTVVQAGDTEPVEFIIQDVATAVAELVQLTLYARGQDPTWPPCSIHEGRHPLEPDSVAMNGDGAEVVSWVCTRTRVGHQYARAGVPVGDLSLEALTTVPELREPPDDGIVPIGDATELVAAHVKPPSDSSQGWFGQRPAVKPDKSPGDPA